MTNRFFTDVQNDRKDKQILHCVQNDSIPNARNNGKHGAITAVNFCIILVKKAKILI